MDERLSQSFDVMKFPLALSVVYLHIDQVPQITTLEFDWTQSNGSFLYYVITILMFKIASIAVPCFFLISGYLLFANIEKMTFDIYFRKINRRFRTLMVPYICWNLLAVAYLYITQHIELTSFVQIFLAPANFPLWFLRNLIVMVLFFPAFYLLINGTRYLGLIIVTVLFIFNTFYSVSSTYGAISFYFFYVGAYGGIYKISVWRIPCCIRNLCYIVTLLLLLILFILYGNNTVLLTRCYLIIGTLSCIFYVYGKIEHKKVRIIPLLTSASFFVYVSHRLGATYISKTFFFFLPRDSYYSATIKYMLCPLITVILCLGVYVFMPKYCSKIFSLLIGRK